MIFSSLLTVNIVLAFDIEAWLAKKNDQNRTLVLFFLQYNKLSLQLATADKISCISSNANPLAVRQKSYKLELDDFGQCATHVLIATKNPIHFLNDS